MVLPQKISRRGVCAQKKESRDPSGKMQIAPAATDQQHTHPLRYLFRGKNQEMSEKT
jgi:hypothetical protein